MWHQLKCWVWWNAGWKAIGGKVLNSSLRYLAIYICLPVLIGAVCVLCCVFQVQAGRHRHSRSWGAMLCIISCIWCMAAYSSLNLPRTLLLLCLSRYWSPVLFSACNVLCPHLHLENAYSSFEVWLTSPPLWSPLWFPQEEWFSSLWTLIFYTFQCCSIFQYVHGAPQEHTSFLIITFQ